MSLMYDALRAGSRNETLSLEGVAPLARVAATKAPADFVLTRAKLMGICAVSVLIGGVLFALYAQRQALESVGASQAEVRLHSNVKALVNPSMAVAVDLPSTPLVNLQPSVDPSNLKSDNTNFKLPKSANATPHQVLDTRQSAVSQLPPTLKHSKELKLPSHEIAAAKVVESNSSGLSAAGSNVSGKKSDSQAARVTSTVASSVSVDIERKVIQENSSAQAPQDTVSLADRFDMLNRELVRNDKSQANVHLKAIQSALPADSIARLRAEGWYAFQTGNNELAKIIYTRLLSRISGDEQATAVIQSIAAQSAPTTNAR
jgi:hypothetical protein